MDVKAIIEQFQDYPAPRLDTYEQALYLYIFRHSRLLGNAEVTIGFKSSRLKMAFGIGVRIPMKVVSDSDLIPVTCSEVKAVVFGAKRRWRSYRA